MPTELMKGIQKIETTTKKEGVKVRYRVQIKQKDFKEDRYFDDYIEAKEFLLTCKSKIGKDTIKFFRAERNKTFNFYKDIYEALPFRDIAEIYVVRYIRPKFSQWSGLKKEELTAEGKFKLRQLTAEKSFFKTINQTRIRPYKPDSYESTVDPNTGEVVQKNQALGKRRGDYVFFGDLKPQEIGLVEINEFAKTLLDGGMKANSVESYLTKISNVFRKLKYIDEGLANVPNPVLQIDKDLLNAYKKNQPSNRNPRVLSKEEKEKMYGALLLRENQDLYFGILFMLYTGLRRSEMVLLKRADCYENFIHIYTNKSDRPRTVYLIPEAQAIVSQEVAKQHPEGRVFNFVSVASFASQFKKCMKKNELEHIKPHMLRKTFITEMVKKLGFNNSLVLATILGNDVKHLEESIARLPIDRPINDQSDLLRQVGHRDSRITQQFYLDKDMLKK